MLPTSKHDVPYLITIRWDFWRTCRDAASHDGFLRFEFVRYFSERFMVRYDLRTTQSQIDGHMMI